jgi:hypothetical protein
MMTMKGFTPAATAALIGAAALVAGPALAQTGDRAPAPSPTPPAGLTQTLKPEPGKSKSFHSRTTAPSSAVTTTPAERTAPQQN